MRFFMRKRSAETRGADPMWERALPSMCHGKVYLVGAGPGDPELITLKGLRCLRAADVVVYDRLVSPVLLDEAPPHVERLFVGKESGCHTMAQEKINALLVEHAQQGRIVVRLKGGDPFVFGRGGEEATALAAAGIPFEVVPGISSAIAVPAYAGIPVTHRGHAPMVTVVTGHEDGARKSCPTPTQAGTPGSSPPVNWEALAALGGTLVILMGVAALPQITQRLLRGGLHANTPAAVIQQGTTPRQRVITGTLADIAERAAISGIGSPAVTVIGTVASLRDSLAWFETRPLREETRCIYFRPWRGTRGYTTLHRWGHHPGPRANSGAATPW
jgi:uroporphyrin-III C-methyltransferase